MHTFPHTFHPEVCSDEADRLCHTAPMQEFTPCPNQRMGKFLIFCLAAFTGVMFYIAVGNWMEFSILSDAVNGIAVHANQLDEVDQRSRFEMPLIALAGLASGIAFLFFTGRTLQVARESGAEGLRYKYGWVVASYFLPIASWFVPYAAMQESWRASNPECGAHDWVASKGSNLIRLWWVLWLATLFTFSFSNAAQTPGLDLELNAYYGQAVTSLGVSLLYLALGIVSLLMVRSIVSRGLAKWEHTHGAAGVPKATIVEAS